MNSNREASIRLALAYLRKKIGDGRFEKLVRESGETDDEWLFDFFHPQWRDLRKTDQPYGYRIAVSKTTGKARQHLALKVKSNARMPEYDSD